MYGRTAVSGAAIFIFVVLAGCDRGADLNSTEVQNAWLALNERKMMEALRSGGASVEKSGESHVKVAEFSRHGQGVCVIFTESKNDPPRVITAACLSPESKDGRSWRSTGYIGLAGSGGTFKTYVYEKSVGAGAPDVGTLLDGYLARRGLKREPAPGEEVIGLF